MLVWIARLLSLTILTGRISLPHGLAPGGRGGRGGQQPARPQAPQKKEAPKINIGGEGSWERTAPGRYVMDINGGKAQANFNKSRLLIKSQGMSLLFSRVY